MNFSEKLDQLSESFLMLDQDNLPEMVAFSDALQNFALQVEDAKLQERFQSAAQSIEQMVIDECDNPDQLMQEIQALLEETQSGTSSINQTAIQLEAGAPFTLPPGTDESIFEMYISELQNKLDELDELILNYEDLQDEHSLMELKRLLHTMKGEAGICGVEDIHRLCHDLEDFIEIHETETPTDTLFAAKDWLTKAWSSYSHSKIPEAPPATLFSTVETGPAVEPESPDSTAETTPVITEPTAEPAPVLREMPAIELSDVDLVRDFVAESYEHFEIANENLLTLESEPSDSDACDAVFRSFHTIKGVAGFLGLTPIGDLSHQAETLLDEVRQGTIPFANQIPDTIFASLDLVTKMVNDLSEALTSGSSFHGRAEIYPLIDRIQCILDGQSGEVAEKTAPATATQPTAPLVQEEVTKEVEPEKNEKAAEPTNVTDTKNEVTPTQEPAPVEKVTQPQPAPPAVQKTTEAAAPASVKTSVARQFVKIDAEKLDLLIDTIGELIIAESIVFQDPDVKSLNSQRLEKNLSHLDKITRILQDMSMALRMVPISGTFQKMARLVRDLAKMSGKKIEFKQVGKDTELDRGMVDKLGDPLIHMIRNSVDHGIEPTEQDRLSVGKPGSATITLKAYHKGGNIHIEICDDGRGLNREAILKKAIERGIVRTDETLTDDEVYKLIFSPGFSTAQQVTEISGRGVGMDVVRRNIESMRGKILIDTIPGQGTTFTIVLPLTMAIIDGMLVKVGPERFILPTLSIIESLKPSDDMIFTVQEKGEMIKFREKLLPLFRLNEVFGLPIKTDELSDEIVIVVEDAGRQVALVAEQLLGQQQTVIKSLGEGIGQIQGISGASILADGHPGLILDVSGIVKMATSN